MYAFLALGFYLISTLLGTLIIEKRGFKAYDVYSYYQMWGILIVNVIFWVCSLTWGYRLNQKVKNAGGLLCGTCGYDLRGLPKMHKCPECGVEYDGDELMKAWKKERIFPWR